MLIAPSLSPSQTNAPILAAAASAGGARASSAADFTGRDASAPGPIDRVDLSAGARNAKGEPLSKEEQKQVDELKKRDTEVRNHEEAHQRVGGQYASAPSYEYQQGPDGKNYAVGGQVQIDTSPVDGDPDATIAKMEIVKRAALAPAEPSGQDRAVAAKADAIAQQAQQEKMDMEREAAAAAARGETPPQDADSGPAVAPLSPSTAPGYGAQPAQTGGLLAIVA